MGDDLNVEQSNLAEGSSESAGDQDEDLVAVKKRLESLNKGGGLLSLSKQEAGLLKAMIMAPDTQDAFIKIVQICDFLDEDEANRELDAFYEAIRLGITIEYNIAHALSRASINRKGAHRNSRVAALLDTMSHQKFTSNSPKGSNVNVNPRSPIA